MADSPKRNVDRLIGRGLIAAETIAAELRSRLINKLASSRAHLNSYQLLNLARHVLAEFEPMLAQSLYDTEVAAWISGVDFVAKRLPAWAEKQIAELGGGSGGKPPRGVSTIFHPPGGGEPIVRFPLIEAAAKRLAEKKIVTREDFDRLASDAKAQAFTVAGISSDQTLTKLRDTLSDLVTEGPSLREFKARLASDLETSQIGPGHLENVYRTNVQTAYSQGHDDLAQNPIVNRLFPYQAYLAIDDGRVRPEHLALMHYGIGGSNIYRTDDPFWDVFSPPWSYNCRCGRNLLTTEAAARKGVGEAQEWLRTGIQPSLESRLPYIPFRPDPRWSTRPRLRAA